MERRGMTSPRTDAARTINERSQGRAQHVRLESRDLFQQGVLAGRKEAELGRAGFAAQGRAFTDLALGLVLEPFEQGLGPHDDGFRDPGEPGDLVQLEGDTARAAEDLGTILRR